ncbi:hypothetical protein ACFYZE_22335 [Streptomyces sp. NPDC001796]|uniref:hypothetical protein n=1 Tax=Streptomyces sp. NPDC001796 TaxID=3364609 RepID=UPI0036B50DC5
MPVTAASTLLAFIGVFDVMGTIASGRLSDRSDARRLLGACFFRRGLVLVSLR